MTPPDQFDFGMRLVTLGLAIGAAVFAGRIFRMVVAAIGG
jgi:hypothetical protein